MSAAAKPRYPDQPIAPKPVVLDTSPVKKPLVQRISPQEFGTTYAIWALPMLEKEFGLSRATAMRFAHTWSMENHYSFVGTGDTISLAMLTSEPLFAKQVVQEVFTFPRDSDVPFSDCAEIYKHYVRWMKMTGAGRFRFYFNDRAPMDELRAVLPRLNYLKTWFVDAGGA